MKRALSFFVALVMVVGVFSSFVCASEEPTPQKVVLNTRTDFLWGQNLHNNTRYNSPDSNSEERVHYAAKQGVKLIRYQGNDITEDFTEMDRIVGLCNRYGMKVMLVLTPTRPDEPTEDDLDYLRKYTKTYADRYNGKEGRGKVDYFQLWNEQQIGLRKSKYGDGGAVDGSSKGHYYDISVKGKQDLIEWTKYFKAAVQGIREADTDAKALINFPRTAWGDIIYYAEHGVEFDGLAWNFYPDSLNPEDTKTQFQVSMYGGLDKSGNPVAGLRNLFPDKEVIITESSTCMNKIPDYENITIEQYDPFVEIMKLAYQQDWIKGLCAFQLTGMPSHPQEAERYYGHLVVDKGGMIIEPRPIYYLYQSMIGGSDSVQLIKKSSIDITPYETFKVKTQNDSDLNPYVPADSGTVAVDLPDLIPDVDLTDAEDPDWLEEPDFSAETATAQPENIFKKTSVTVGKTDWPWALFLPVAIGLPVVMGAGFFIIFFILRRKKKSAIPSGTGVNSQ